jgi:hypothetical protein
VSIKKETQSQRWVKEESWDGCEKASSRANLAEESVHSNPCQDKNEQQHSELGISERSQLPFSSLEPG